MIIKTDSCRLCKGTAIHEVLDLGEHALSGVFPAERQVSPLVGPLQIGICEDCNLVQLLHSYPSDLMYGDNYGYRSGLNKSMVKHLQKKAHHISEKFIPREESVILDIGSNDGTLLNALVNNGSQLIGMDPTSDKFAEFYDSKINRIANFFSEHLFLSKNPQADLIFSVAMFYDLENPVEFVNQISSCLTKDGVWHFEQSYLISMLDTNSFDTICHEHVEYYSFRVIEEILSRAEMRVIDIELNDINGGSIAITAAHINSRHVESIYVDWLRRYEAKKIPDVYSALRSFRDAVHKQREIIQDLVSVFKSKGYEIWGVGASTKGNTLLQYCNLDKNSITAIAEVNSYKFDRFTPGSGIPIKSEQAMLRAMPEIGIVLPWHFKSTIIAGNQEYLNAGGKLVFPLPNIDIVS